MDLSEEKSTFMIRVFSGTTNEDLAGFTFTTGNIE